MDDLSEEILTLGVEIGAISVGEAAILRRIDDLREDLKRLQPITAQEGDA